MHTGQFWPFKRDLPPANIYHLDGMDIASLLQDSLMNQSRNSPPPCDPIFDHYTESIESKKKKL